MKWKASKRNRINFFLIYVNKFSLNVKRTQYYENMDIEEDREKTTKSKQNPFISLAMKKKSMKLKFIDDLCVFYNLLTSLAL